MLVSRSVFQSFVRKDPCLCDLFLVHRILAVAVYSEQDLGRCCREARQKNRTILKIAKKPRYLPLKEDLTHIIYLLLL